MKRASLAVLMLGTLLPALALQRQPLVAAAEPTASAAAAVIPATTALGSGPWHAVMEVPETLPTHTVYHPKDLAAAAPLPVVLWGNGACADAGDRFRWFLSDIASYGYVVLAIGPIRNQSDWPPQLMVPIPAGASPAIPKGKPIASMVPQTRTAQLLQALDWATRENERPGSQFYHRLNVKAVATMGQSCGGAQALEAALDPRVRTTMLFNSGLFAGVTTMGGGRPLTKQTLTQLHAPIAYISGDDEDLAYANANDDFKHINQVPVFRAYLRGAVHEGTYSERNGGEFAGVAVAWLNWQLRSDRHAARLFIGPDCGLCVNPQWVVHGKNLQ